MYRVDDRVNTQYGTGIVRQKYRDMFEWFYKVELANGSLVTFGERQLKK